MNKKDIKNTLKQIEPDEYLYTRLKTKLNTYTPQRKTNLSKLTASATAFCCLIIIIAVAIGVNLTKSTDYIATGKLTVNEASPESENATLNTEDTTDGVAVSNPNWLNNRQEEIDNKNTSLIVDGKNITKNHYIKFSSKSNYVDISLTAIIEALGGKICWINNENADVILNGKRYIMGARYGNFVEIKTEKNLFADKDGSVHSNPQKINGEFVMDNRSIKNLMENLGYEMEIDFENKTITIS